MAYSCFKSLRNLGMKTNVWLRTKPLKCILPSSLILRSSYTSDANEPLVEDVVRAKLQKALQPEYLDVINESAMHNVPKGSASHMRVIVISHMFNDKNLVQRHRMINNVLADEMKGPIHALAIEAIAAKDGDKKTNKNKSPPCKGGMGL